MPAAIPLLSSSSPNDLGEGYTAISLGSQRGDDGIVTLWTVSLRGVEVADVALELDPYADAWSIKETTPVNATRSLASALENLLTRQNDAKRKYHVLVGMCRYGDCSDRPRARRVPVRAHTGRGAIENLRRLVDQERAASSAGVCILGRSTHKYVGPVYANVLDQHHLQLHGSEIERF